MKDMDEKEIRKHLTEALHQSKDLAESGVSLDKAFIEAFQKLYPYLDSEKAIHKFIGERVKGIDELIGKIERGDSLEKILKTEQAGTGILMYEQKAIHSLKTINDLPDVKIKLRILNSLRLQYVGGSENDGVSISVKELTK